MAVGTKKNFIYNSAYSILNMGLPLVTAPYLARIIGAEGTGIYAYSFSIAQFVILIAKLGLTNYGTREIAKVRGNQDALNQLFSRLFGLQCCSTVLISICYAIYAFCFSSEHFIMALVFLIWVVGTFSDIDWFWFGLEDFRRVSIRNITVKLLSVAGIFLFVKTKSDTPLYALIMVSGYVCGYLTNWIGLRKRVRILPQYLLDFKEHLFPCSLLLIPTLALNVYRSLNRVMLGAMSTMVQTGIFDNGEKIVYCLSGLIASFGSVMMPKMSKLVAEGDSAKIEHYISLSLRLMAIMTSMMAFCLLAVADSLIDLLFGAEFSQSANILRLSGFALIAMGLGNVIRMQYIIPSKIDDIYVKSTLISSILNVLINVLLIPRLAALGAAIASLVAESFVPLYQYFRLRSRFDYSKAVLASVPYYLIGLASALPALLVQRVFGISVLTLILQLFVGSILFIPLTVLWAHVFDKTLFEFGLSIVRRKKNVR